LDRGGAEQDEQIRDFLRVFPGDLRGFAVEIKRLARRREGREDSREEYPKTFFLNLQLHLFR
jgi:hypothetical protein